MDKNNEEKNVEFEGKKSAGNVSISEAAKQIESGKVSPAEYSKRVLRQIALYFKSRRYDSGTIADILQCDVRTIERYVKNAQDQNMLNFDMNFQRKVADNFYKNYQAQYARVLRLSYSDNLPIMEKLKIIRTLNEIDVNGIEGLKKLGYISETHGNEEKKIFEDHYQDTRDEFFEKASLSVFAENTKLIVGFKGTPQEGLALMEKIRLSEGPLVKNLIDSIKRRIERINKGKVKDNFSSDKK